MAPPADRIDVRGGARGALTRLVAAWRGLRAVQRLAIYGALALFVSMLLPWYSKSAVGVSPSGKPVKADDTLNAFQAFSFVEAAVLLVAVAVIVLLLARGEGRAFHLPGGDGTVVLAAGIWVCLLVFYRQFDKPGADHIAGLATTVGVTWGIFVTFLCGLFLAYAGTRLRAAHVGEPPLPGDVAPSDAPAPDPGDPGPRAPSQRRGDPDRPGAGRPADPGRPRPARDQALTVVDPNDATASTRVVPRRPDRPAREGRDRPQDEPTPGQLSFEQDDPGEHDPGRRR
jgi:hypothetical protein